MSYAIICKGTRRFVEDIGTMPELMIRLTYYGLPMHLADFSKAPLKDGYKKNSFRWWEVCEYPEWK